MKFVFKFPDGSTEALEVGGEAVEGRIEALGYLQTELCRLNTPITSAMVDDLSKSCLARAQNVFPNEWKHEPNLCAITQIKKYFEEKDSHKALSFVRLKSERRVSFSEVLDAPGEEIPVVFSGKKASLAFAVRSDEFATPADQRKPVVSPSTARRVNDILERAPRAVSASPTIIGVSEDKSCSVTGFSPIGISPIPTSKIAFSATFWRRSTTPTALGKSSLAVERAQSQPLPRISPHLLASWPLKESMQTFYKVVDRPQGEKSPSPQTPAPSHRP